MTQRQQGTGGDDTLTGTDPGNPANADGIDTIIGLSGDDILSGLGGDDVLDGGGGADTFYGGAGADRFFGGTGVDTASYDSAAATAGVQVSLETSNNTGAGTGGEAEGDILIGIENLVGSRFDDTLLGNAEANALAGGAGDDSIKGGAGADAIDGGEGIDTVYYDASTAGVVVNLATGTGTGGDAQGDTLSGIENVVGSAFNDTLMGNDTLNSFDGGEGIDTVYYDRSEDPIIVDLATGQGSGYGDSYGDTYQNIENVHGTALDDVLIGDGGDNSLIGADGDDTLRSGAGDDVISGGNGDDHIAGYGGADAIDGGAGVDTIYYDAAAVTVNLGLGQGFGGDAQGDTYQNVENVVGTAFDDTLIGDGGANSLTGGDGDDTIQSGAGNDVVSGGDGNDAINAYGGADAINGGAGIDTVYYDGSTVGVTVNLATGQGFGGNAQGDTLVGIENVVGTAFNDTLTGDGGENVLTGGDGDDTLRGGVDSDRLDGGNGVDTADYAASFVAVFIRLQEGVGSSGDAAGDRLISIENLIGSVLDDGLTGSARADGLSGGGGDDGIQGGAGADRIDGGSGVDTAGYSMSTDGVTVDLAAGTGTGSDAEGDTLTGIENVSGSDFSDWLYGDGGANALSGWAGGDSLVGAAGNDTIDGGFGNDLLRGGAGADALIGGAGVDIADYAASGAGIVVDLAAGTGAGGDAQGDTLQSIENLVGSAFADKLFGDGGANALSGGAGNDELYGGAGADVLDGGSGKDTAGYFSSGAAVTVDLAAGTGSGGDAQGDVLSNIENLGGSVFNDILTGNAGINAINGGGGNDSISGAAGSDTLYGGNGNDQIDGGADGDALSGAAGTDTLAGGAGNDAINGGADADAINGGAGIDIADYNGSGVGVTVNLATNINTGGYAQGDMLTNVENVQGSAFADTLTGDGVANTLWGMAGNDGLNGGAGWDTLEGGDGDDQLNGGAGGDILRGGAGADHLTGGADSDTASYWDSTAGVTINLQTGVNTGGTAQGDTIASDVEIINGSNRNDVMTGNALANELVGFDGIDTLSGGGGSDTLRGGAGADVLNGGSGVDNFSYTALSDGTVSAADTIQDFQAGDLIWVRTIDADGNSGNGDTAFSFIGAGAFSGTAGELRAVTSGGTQVVYADVNGDTVADFAINVTADHALTASDFVL